MKNVFKGLAVAAGCCVFVVLAVNGIAAGCVDKPRSKIDAGTLARDGVGNFVVPPSPPLGPQSIRIVSLSSAGDRFQCVVAYSDGGERKDETPLCQELGQVMSRNRR